MVIMSQDFRHLISIVEAAEAVTGPKTLAAVERLATELGVEIDVERFGSNSLRLIWIDRMNGGRAGAGAQVMRALCAYADEKGLSVILTVWEGAPRLTAYYEKFGFVMRGDPDDAEPKMVRSPQGGLLEDANGGLTFNIETHGFSHGQKDLSLVARMDGKTVGKIDFSDYEGEISLKFIKTAPDMTRQGIATQMMRRLQAEYPGTEIAWGGLTDDGAEFRASLAHDVVDDPAIRRQINLLPRLKAKRDKLMQWFSSIEGPLSDEQKAEAETRSAWLNRLHSMTDRLEQQTHDRKPTKSLVRIVELTGTKKYQTRSFWDVIQDFERAGGQVLGTGKYSKIIWHPRWDYVLKVFPRDDSYLRFARFAKRNQQVAAFPRILGGPWKIVPFYQRPATEPYVYVVKTERLLPIRDPELRKNIATYVHNGWQMVEHDSEPSCDEGVEALRKAKTELLAATSREAREQAMYKVRGLREWEHFSQMRETWDRYPTLRELCVAFRMVMEANLGADDNHSGNYMQREDGTLVIIDPVWAGESYWEMQNAAMRAEMMIDDEPAEPDEYNSIKGGKLRPKKRPKLSPQSSAKDDDDFPF
jgi:predicted N-acetyltransferase YhbS